jgi:hypothetical protein
MGRGRMKKRIAARIPREIYDLLQKLGDGSITEGIKRICYAYIERMKQ